jgi:hypothetical protein
MGPVHRFVDAWMLTPLWWKGFYIVFPLSFVLLTALTGDARYGALWAFVWGAMVAGALWLSERLKARRAGVGGRRSSGPQYPDRRDVRGPRR